MYLSYLRTYLPIYFTYLSTYLPSYLPTYVPTYLSIYLSILPTYLPIYLSIYLIYLPTYLPTYLPIYVANPVAPTWSIMYPWNASLYFSFLILDSRWNSLDEGSARRKGFYLHTTTQTQNKRTQTSMPLVGLEPTIPVSERTKTVHALDRAATVIGHMIM
jgi:hypothetical protein